MNHPVRSYLLLFTFAILSAAAHGGTNTNLTQLAAPGVLRDAWAPTPDSERVVFVALGESKEEVYSVRLDEPGQIVQLSRNGEDFDGAAEVVNFEVSEDSQHVVYLVRVAGIMGDRETLLTVPVDGSTTPSTLSMVDVGMLGAGGIGFDLSPASDRVVYVETTEAEFPLTESVLFSQPIAGGEASTLHPASLGISFEISRSGAYVVYAVLSLMENAKIFSIPTTGGSGVQLNDDSDLPGIFSVGPNSQRVVFTAIGEDQETNTLQSAPITGGGQTTLATAAGNAAIGAFGINNDTGSPRVAFVESTDAGQSRLASVPIAGGGEEDLTNGLIDGGISPFRFSPDGQWVVFQVIEPVEGTEDFTAELLSAPMSGLGPGGAPSTFFKGSAANAGFNFVPSFDSTRVLYGAVPAEEQAGDTPGTQELLSAGVNGSNAETLVGPLTGNLRVFFFFPFFDSQNVFYVADQEQDEVFELYTVPIAGGTITKRNGPLPTGGDVTSAFSTPDSSNLIYDADQVADGLFDLFLVPEGQEPSELIFGGCAGSFECP